MTTSVEAKSDNKFQKNHTRGVSEEARAMNKTYTWQTWHATVVEGMEKRVESAVLPSSYALPIYNFDLRASHARTLLPAQSE